MGWVGWAGECLYCEMKEKERGGGSMRDKEGKQRRLG